MTQKEQNRYKAQLVALTGWTAVKRESVPGVMSELEAYPGTFYVGEEHANGYILIERAES